MTDIIIIIATLTFIRLAFYITYEHRQKPFNNIYTVEEFMANTTLAQSATFIDKGTSDNEAFLSLYNHLSREWVVYFGYESGNEGANYTKTVSLAISSPYNKDPLAILSYRGDHLIIKGAEPPYDSPYTIDKISLFDNEIFNKLNKILTTFLIEKEY